MVNNCSSQATSHKPQATAVTNLIQITLADLIVRSAYQMGKTPLLPIFAASLGASDVLLGLIVSVSTLTGMVTKPLFGLLSDRMGRRLWLVIGTLIFAGVPFLYRFINTPEQLIAIRLFHGTATAIYGPVTVAYVVERGGKHKAERLGWLGMARSGGYIIGPTLAGWLLLSLDPVAVFTFIGVVSLAAFVPVLTLGEKPVASEEGKVASSSGCCSPLSSAVGHWCSIASHCPPAIWLSGALEATVFVTTYVIKAFLPVYALTAGYSTAEIGLFFSVQEGTLILLKPCGGRLGDRLGYLRAVSLGMTCLALMLPLFSLPMVPETSQLLRSLLPAATNGIGLLTVAVVMGASQALIFPATVALIAEQIPAGHIGTGIGLAGSLKNAGKVAGPVLGGVLIARLGYGGMFWLLAGVLLAGALFIVQPRLRRSVTNLKAAV